MKKVELLAPAKDKETAITAIESGADAIYIGSPKFGARQAVGNSIEDIKEVVNYAHKFYVKVHVTINTILTDDELEQAQELIKNLYEIGVDAIIVQDMGIFKLALDNKLPPIPLHASTQCNNRTLEKAEFFKNLGVSRVILARELSIDQIKEICKTLGNDCEVETFIHGALCVSYSGQCYMSYYIGGRSANRGECAQACRKKYSLIDETGKIIAKDKYLLSLKDFNASKYLEQLIKAGVKSFKIEGRLKDKNYVKNVVAYYRKEIDKFAHKSSSGKVFLDFEPDVSKSFNRGFTDYFLDGRKKCFNFDTPKSVGEYLGKITKIGKDWFEIACNKELHPQDGLCFGGKGCLINKVVQKKIYPNKMDGIKVGVEVSRNFDANFEKQLKNSKTKRRIETKFIFENNKLKVIDEDNNSVEIELISNETPQNQDKMKETFIKQLQKTGDSDFYVSDIKINGELPFLPISKINEIRRMVLANLMQERLKNYVKEVQKPLKYLDYPQKNLDFKYNIHNNQAKCFYENCNCNICEMSFESNQKLSQIKSKIELMRTKHCLKYAFDMCKSPKKLFLQDEKGKKYPLEFDCKNCEMIILSQT
jgi:putative protease